MQALVAYGEMALSAIEELPPGRLPVRTTMLVDTPQNCEQVRSCAALR